MPIVDIKLASDLAVDASLRPMLASIARSTSAILGKPLKDVMVLCSPAQVSMDGSSAPAAMITVRCLSGLSPRTGQAICEAVRMALQAVVVIDESRVYLDLSHVEPDRSWRFVSGDPMCAHPSFKRESAMTEWSVRTLLNPVMTRILIAGVNPFDLERVMRTVESTRLLHARQLEQAWLSQWESCGHHFVGLAEAALQNEHLITARDMYLQAAHAYLACFLINFASLDEKKRVYLRYAELYAKAGALYPKPLEFIDIPLPDKRRIPAVLHLPTGKALGAVVVYSGLGSCKEEMHHLARFLADRGVAALVPDMPGSGETLFVKEIPCRRSTIDATFAAALDLLEARDDVGPAVGCCGLCMGGGYAYRAAARESRYRFCVGLFPLFITDMDESATPLWMRSGPWFEKQTGGLPAKDFLAEMHLGTDEILTSPFLMIHGRHDNWETLDQALALFDRATSPENEKVIIDEKPVFSGDEVFTHTMPVGEQLHWVGPMMADWVVRKLDSLETLPPEGAKPGTE